jgi:hypothetical protein
MDQILLVEGINDKAVFGSIFKHHKLPEGFKIEVKGDVEKLIRSIPVHVKTDVKTIGIVIDADFNIDNQRNRWEAIKNKLTNIGYNVPDELHPEGTIIKNDELPVIGIWVMPDNNSDGMLEDFVTFLVPEDDELMPFVDETLIDLEEKGLNKYKGIHRAKARIHTWLAWQESPGTPMGLAITKKYLDIEKEECQIFVKWITNLFNLPFS